jgi:hypothetical protein
VDQIADRLFLRKSGSARNRTRDIWICSQELCPLDHRGGPSNRNHTLNYFSRMLLKFNNRLYGLVVRVPGC